MTIFDIQGRYLVFGERNELGLIKKIDKIFLSYLL